MIAQPTYLQLLQNIAFLLSLILIFDLLRVKVQGTHIKAKFFIIGFLIVFSENLGRSHGKNGKL